MLYSLPMSPTRCQTKHRKRKCRGTPGRSFCASADCLVCVIMQIAIEPRSETSRSAEQLEQFFQAELCRNIIMLFRRLLFSKSSTLTDSSRTSLFLRSSPHARRVYPRIAIGRSVLFLQTCWMLSTLMRAIFPLMKKKSDEEVSGDSSDEGDAIQTEVKEAEEEVATSTDAPPVDRTPRNMKRRYTWVKKYFDIEAGSFENNFPLPPAEPLSAVEYFDMFVSRSMLKAVVDESNKYYFQKHETTLNLTVEKLTPVLGMFFRMGLVNMHRVRAYWENGSRYELVAQVMCHNRFEKITSHLQFFDNEAANDKVKEDKCWKVRPWLSSLRSNMVVLPQEKKSAVDEILIPFCGRCYIRQYMPNKPKSKWGLKLWARSGESGLCYDFDVYQRCNKGFYGSQGGYQLGLGAAVVLQLCSSLPKRDDNLVVAGNFFTGPQLVEELSRMGISYIGTVRENILNCSKLMEEKLMKKQGRGTCDTSVTLCNQKTMAAAKWHDNRTVTLLSNCIGADSLTSVKRWDSKEKKHIFSIVQRSFLPTTDQWENSPTGATLQVTNRKTGYTLRTTTRDK
ncbi:hypothetical protein HPB51_003161 [Rhipicephalus microplus]|uniref:PiggyBac transposable element-derived protein domain-containing protein n=1 Tax=Rhipicephalus microplus TaxID=6941 RepID=A0A9J6EKK3_RHIMP|nr:hypothetical protein HPB51_003161 [Rhipicephalus microplus]